MKKVLILLMTCILTLFAMSCYAVNISVNYETGLITLEDECADSESALVWIREKESGAYVYADLIFPEAGKFTSVFSLKPGASEGIYYTVVYVKDTSVKEEEYDFYNAGETIKSGVISGLTSVLSEEDAALQTTKLDAWVVQYAAALNIDTQVYNSLNSKADLIALLKEMPRETYTDIMDGIPVCLSDAYKIQQKENVIDSIKASSAEAITGILENNGSLFGIELDETYYSYSAYVNDLLKQSTNINIENFEECFKEIMAIPYVNAAERSKIDTVIKQQDKYLNIYDKIHSNDDAVVVEILKKLEATEFKSVAEIEQAIGLVVEESKQIPPEEDFTDYGGSSGGKNVTVKKPIAETTPIQPELPTIQEENKDDGIFSDISEYSWAKESIEYLGKKGIINGKEDGKFAPGDNITRAEVVKILVNAFEVAQSTNIRFEDVEDDKWYYTYICAATEAGFVNGREDGKFYPNEFVSRQDIAVMIYRAAKISSGNTEPPFEDDALISDYAKPAIAALYEKGIFKGNGNGKAEPLANCTRAECAKLVYEVIK